MDPRPGHGSLEAIGSGGRVKLFGPDVPTPDKGCFDCVKAPALTLNGNAVHGFLHPV